MEVDKQMKFKSHQRMQVEFISNNLDVMTHECLSSVALALGYGCQCYSVCRLRRRNHLFSFGKLPEQCDVRNEAC